MTGGALPISADRRSGKTTDDSGDGATGIVVERWGVWLDESITLMRDLRIWLDRERSWLKSAWTVRALRIRLNPRT